MYALLILDVLVDQDVVEVSHNKLIEKHFQCVIDQVL